MADAQSAERTAVELGAVDEPQANLSLELAQDQIGKAQKAIELGYNARAESLLIRAKADAELAIALSREKNAKALNQRALADAAAQKATSVGQGAAK